MYNPYRHHQQRAGVPFLLLVRSTVRCIRTPPRQMYFSLPYERNELARLIRRTASGSRGTPSCRLHLLYISS